MESELIKKLRADQTALMKSQNMEELNVIRGVLSEVNLREMKNIKMTDEEVIKVLRSEAKKRKESIESFEKGGRQDLVDKEKREMAVLERYLPAEMSDADILAKIKEVIANSEDKSFGTIMKASVTAINGQADGKRISAAVKTALENK